MIDLHTHTLLSDGVLLPSELVRRAIDKGYKAIALADHVDASNIDFIVPRLAKVAKQLNKVWDILVIPAAELTHIPLEHIEGLTKRARRFGAKLVLMHGETKSEPVLKGTNKQALISNVDILAHPGQLTRDELKLAIKNNVYLEITTRMSHKKTNKHLVKITSGTQAKLILNTDTHSPRDLITKEKAQKFLLSLGLNRLEREKIFLNSEKLISKLQRKKA